MVAMQPLQPEDIDRTASAPPAEQAVDVQHGLVVYSQDGRLLGRIGEFIIDTAGDLTSFIVRAESSLQRDVRIHMNWIHMVTRDHVLLRITAAEAMAADLAARRSTARQSG